MKISRYTLSVDHVPVDFFADPDGAWEFNHLVEAAGFDPERPGIVVGALIEPFQGHPEGCAVVTEIGRSRSFVAIVECGADTEQAQFAAREAAAQRVRTPKLPALIVHPRQERAA